MDVQPVLDAYSAVSERYIDACGSISQEHDADVDLVQRHLTGLPGPVLDLGCGPGHWTGHLRSLGADVTGVDLVPEFVAHARARHLGVPFRVGSMTQVDAPAHSVAGVLSWYSTIHLRPAELDRVLAVFRRLLKPSGVLVIGFFDSADGVTTFNHAVLTARRWPVDVLAAHLAEAGFTELERVQHQRADRPDRRYAALAATATSRPADS